VIISCLIGPYGCLAAGPRVSSEANSRGYRMPNKNWVVRPSILRPAARRFV